MIFYFRALRSHKLFMHYLLVFTGEVIDYLFFSFRWNIAITKYWQRFTVYGKTRDNVYIFFYMAWWNFQISKQNHRV